MHGNTILLFRKHAKSYFKPGMRVLEIGADPGLTLAKDVGDPSIKWESVDIAPAPHIAYIANNEYSFPIADDSFDIVIAANVMEHVRKIWTWARELTRVCKPGGLVITINPVSWPYHEYPIDCWRAYPEGMKALYDEAGLEVLLSSCESIEDSHLKRHIPGRSVRNILDHQGWKTKALTRMSVMLRLPVERPYDTVTIGRKLNGNAHPAVS